MSSTETQPQPVDVSAPSRLRMFPLLVLVALTIVVLVSGLHRFASLDTVVALRDQFHLTIEAHRLLAILAFSAVYICVVALSLPGAVLCTLTAGLIFGWLIGGLVSLVSATIGAVIVFGIARSSGGERLAARAGPQAAKLQAGFCENALSYLLFLRLVPIFPFFAVNIVPALMGVPFRTFLIGTLFGIMPASFAYSSAGAGLDSAILAAKAAQAHCVAAGIAAECPLSLQLATLLTPELKIAFALLSVLALIPVGYKFWRRRHGSDV